jgi:small nuclear ribonucleoprotein D3
MSKEASSGIPVKLLHEAVGTIVTAELDNGDLYTGRLTSTEDNINVQLDDAKKTTKGGKVHECPTVFIRGSNIVFVQLPEALKASPAVQAALLAVEGTAVDGRAQKKGGFGAASRPKVTKRGRDE